MDWNGSIAGVTLTNCRVPNSQFRCGVIHLAASCVTLRFRHAQEHLPPPAIRCPDAGKQLLLLQGELILAFQMPRNKHAASRIRIITIFNAAVFFVQPTRTAEVVQSSSD